MENEDIRASLQRYGLNELLSDQDDPYLWMAIAEEHWINFENVRQPIPRLLFGVGKVIKVIDNNPQSMEMTEEWGFRVNDYGKIQSVQIVSRNEPDLYPEYVLQVSRPSVNQSVAIVCAGGHPAPLIGYIESRIWQRQNENTWKATDKILSSMFF